MADYVFSKASNAKVRHWRSYADVVAQRAAVKSAKSERRDRQMGQHLQWQAGQKQDDAEQLALLHIQLGYALKIAAEMGLLPLVWRLINLESTRSDWNATRKLRRRLRKDLS